MKSKIWAIVPAAGSGRRLNASLPKQYQKLCDKSVLQHTLQTLRLDDIAATVVVLSKDDRHWQSLELSEKSRIHTCLGGQERYLSVAQGLKAAADLGAEPKDWILIHDAARPCLHPETLTGLIASLATERREGLIVAVPCRDTMKSSGDGTTIAETVDRQHLWHAQTPQCFRMGPLQEAVAQVIATGKEVTDEAEALEHFGGTIGLYPGRYDNIKITFPEDLTIAKAILKNREGSQVET